LKGVFNGRKRVSKKNNKKEPVTLTIIIFILSLIGVFIAANLIISSGTKIAEDFGIAKMAVGIILIASATTLPELVFGVSATEMKHSRMAIGDQIGAIIIHAGLILGIVALIHPIPVQLSTFLLPMLFVIVSAAFLAFCIHFRRKLSRIEGILLILIYLIFMLTQILKNNNFY
jgi:cation:H+ antiporter